MSKENFEKLDEKSEEKEEKTEEKKEKAEEKLEITIKVVNGNEKVVEDDEKDIKTNIKLNAENAKNDLSKIRKKLEENELIRMNYELLFFKDAYIPYDEEYNHTLESVMKENTVCLKKYPKPTSKYFMKKFNLDHEFIFIEDKANNKVEIKEASKGILSHVSSKLTTLDNETDNQYVEFNSKESWTKQINSFLSAKTEIINFGSLQFSFSNTEDTNLQTERRSSYAFTKVSKMSLKFDKLEPTQEFIDKVNEIMEQRDCEKLGKLREICGKFERFVLTKIILGGMIQYHTEQSLDEHSRQRLEEVATSAGPDFQGRATHGQSTTKLKGSSMRCSNLIGGEQQDLDNFDNSDNKDKWFKSLDNYVNWKCIEFRDPISIFHLLDDKLRKEISKIFGKKILYSKVIPKSIPLDCEEQCRIKLLEECEEIHKIINNKDAECNIFATVVDDEKKKNIFFNCQVCRLQDDPQIIISCFQKKRVLTHKLRIGFMIIGYDVDFNCNSTTQVEVKEFLKNDICHNKMQVLGPDSNKFYLGIPVLDNLILDDSIVIGHYFLKECNSIKVCVFSYCLKNEKFVGLTSNFSFHVLIAKTNTIIPFEKKMWKKIYIDLEKFFKSNWTENNISSDPKYISVCAIKNSCGPVFLKQKKKVIKLKYVSCKCNKTCSHCKDKKYKSSDIRCNYFDLDKKVIFVN